MPSDVAIKALIPPELDQALTRLASTRRKRKSTLLREALAAYVKNEQEFEAAVEEGRADIRADRLVDHGDVVREIRQILAPHR
jgi:predicted transcriptional regulator